MTSEMLALLGGRPVRPTPLPYAHQTIEPDDLAAVGEALTADRPLVARFEQALADRAGVKHAVTLANGTAALHAACWAAGLGRALDKVFAPLRPMSYARCRHHAREPRAMSPAR